MSEVKKLRCQQIGGITLCKECDAMYWGTPDNFVRDAEEALLPCGHKMHSIIFSGAVIKDAIKAEQLLEWFANNGMIDSQAEKAAAIAGGSYNRDEFLVPPRDLTDEEYEDIMMG